MARLDGKKTALWPYILGLAVLAALGAGAYLYSQSSGAISPPPGTSALPASGTGAEATPATTPAVTQSDPTSNAADGANGNAATSTAAPDATTESATTEGGTTSSPQPGNTAAAGSSATPFTTPATVAGDDAGEAGTTSSSPTPVEGAAKPIAPTSSSQNETSGNGNNSIGKKEVIARRSKTVTNTKTGTSITYTRETLGDGSMAKSKTAGATPVQQ